MNCEYGEHRLRPVTVAEITKNNDTRHIGTWILWTVVLLLVIPVLAASFYFRSPEYFGEPLWPNLPRAVHLVLHTPLLLVVLLAHAALLSLAAWGYYQHGYVQGSFDMTTRTIPTRQCR